MKKILFASAECAPFVKTGGLGAVVGSLPKQLNHEKYDVRVVLPDYHCIDAKWREQMETLVTFPMYLGWRMQTVTVKTLKYEGIVYKRRERMILSEAVPYLAGKSEPGFDSQILHEITWFRNYYRGLAPAMYIAYERIACFGTEDRNFRVTFDTNIRWRTDNLCLDGPTEGTRLLEPGWYLMEVKTPGAVPLWFSKILDDLAIYPASFSKYGFAYQIENQKASEEKAFIPFTDIRQTVSKTAFR